MKIAVIEDNAKTAKTICKGLTAVGWECEVFNDPQSGVLAVTTKPYDALVLDRMLPGLDGIDTLRMIRGFGQEIPVIFLSARTSIADRVSGIEAGADDYLVKPFAMAELVARIKLITRRKDDNGSENSEISIADLHIDRMSRRVTRSATKLILSPVEFKLLENLMLCKGTVVGRKLLLENVWGYRFDPSTSIVETHMSRLRAKVDKPFETKLIHTVRGSGYLITEP